MDQNIRNLINKCIEGDRNAQRILYDKYKDRFYALCLRYASNVDEAQDIMIEAFLKVFNSLKNYRGDGEFEGWLYRIFSNHAINYMYRSKKDALSNKVKEDINENTLLEKINVFNNDTRDVLLRYLQCLNVRERTIFNMIAIEEYTFAEAAEELHIKKTVVKTYFYRARASLQTMLKENEKELLKEYNMDK